MNANNARVVRLDAIDGTDAIAYLRATYAEIQRRFAQLVNAQCSTWGRMAGSTQTMIVMDEFSNLADSMSAQNKDELWRWARMIAAEGRKAGIHMVIALQDPTHKSIDLRIRRNTTPVAFRVKDNDASHVVLGAGGAERLPARQFLTALDKLVRGMSFAPTDEELASFLARKQRAALPPPEWLSLDAPTAQADDAICEELEQVEQVRALAAQGKSARAIEMEIFGYTGGKAYELVRAALAAGATTATTTNKNPEMA